MKTLAVVCVLGLIALGTGGCAPPFSELQSAKLVDEGEFEIAGHYSAVSWRYEGEGEKVQDHIGVQFAVGVFEKLNLRFRYEHISYSDSNLDLNLNYNVFAFGPKFALAKDVIAFYMPVGFATGEDINVADTWQLHPTLLVTATPNEVLEVTVSVKYLLTLEEDSDDLLAFNLGLGLSHDLSRYAIRPEGGILINPGEDGIYWQFSLGLSLFP